MESLPFLGVLAGHVYLIVFVASTIDAVGIPFPGRIVLILAGTFLETKLQLAGSILAGAAGALLGDHLLYLAGWRGGPALLSIYCRLTLSSERCVEDAVKYFRRFGAPAILLSRYSTGVRLFAAILSGCGYIGYRRFLACDIVGSLVYATLWVVLGHTFGEQVSTVLVWLAHRRAIVLILPGIILGIVAYRIWRRRRFGAARAGVASGPPGPGAEGVGSI